MSTNRINIRRLRTRAIAVSPHAVPPRSSSVPSHRSSWEEASDLGLIGQRFSSELDINHCEGIRDQLKFAAKQLNDQVHLCIS